VAEKRSKSPDKQNGNSKKAEWLKPYHFKPGQSGNPKGRPPKELTLTPKLLERINDVCPSDSQGRTWGEVIIETTLTHAAKGNAAALRELWNRIDGKQDQALSIEGEINVNHIDVEEAGKLLMDKLSRIKARQKDTTIPKRINGRTDSGG